MEVSTQNLEIVLEYLDKIGEQIGMTGEMIWPWLIKQQYIHFFLCLGILVFALINTPVVWHLISKYRPWSDNRETCYWQKDLPIARVVLCGWSVVVAALFIIGGAGTLLNLPDILNPEYWALKDLMEMIKGAAQ